VTTAASPSEGGGDSALGEVVVSTSCRVVDVVSASRAATEACSSSRRKGNDTHVGMSLSTLLLDGLEGGHFVEDVLL
jgi:hypothetical protein